MASQRQSQSSSGANRTSASISGDAKFKNTEEGESGNRSVAILTTIARMKKQVAADRQAYVKAKMEGNAEKVRRFSTHLLALSSLRSNKTASVLEKDMLHTKIQRAYNRFTTEVDSDQPGDSQEDFSAPILFNASGVKSIVKPVRLCTMQKIPPYTTWTFLDKNQRMADDQSVVGRRRIYYDSDGNEALVCSDTDDDEIEEEEEKREFSKGDEFVIRETAEEHGACRPVWKGLAECLDAKTSEIEARYEVIIKGGEKIIKPDDDKPDLASAMDSFDKLFCRRCLVFDCRLHGCNQPIVYSCEKQSSEIKTGALPSQPCGSSCFHLKRLSRQDEGAQNASFQVTATIQSDIPMQDVKDTSKVTKTAEEAPRKGIRDSNVNALRKLLKRKASQLKEHSQTECDHEGAKNKRVKTAYVKKLVAKKYAQRKWKTNKVKRQGNENLTNVKQDLKEYKEFNPSEAVSVDDSNWNTLEKDLYEKGLEMFGSDSCLIAKYTLKGYKTCTEVGELMRQLGHWKFAEETKLEEDNANADEMDNELRQRRRRGRVRKLKYTWKVGAAIRKRLIDGKEGCRQYTPCSCTTSCGKQCSCHRNGTCCEKYCGCPKSCKNRFRGCHCAKSQCSSRQCPCFAAGRECDPDVCRNCWAGCGDGTLGRPPPRHETCYECRNMKLLLKQQQKILLARSDVAGWGAFLKTPVNKHDYLGEYTGELISHREADKRGKIYDRANSSFLFNLNDQYVLDACRKGDKLKFANHSLNPNCYAKVIMVAGDHRVGIYAKEKISAGEELFYDYGYEDRFNISWAKKPEDNNKHDEHASGSGRAQKQAKKCQLL